MTRLNDSLESWRKLEGKLLQRMNDNNFPSNEAPDSLWNTRVYKQLQKVKKLYRKTHIRPTPEEYTWSHVLKRTRHRYYGKYFEIIEEPDDYWTINIKTNKLKINTMHLRYDWVQCIFQNLEKFR
jgi:hypothetical protein